MNPKLPQDLAALFVEAQVDQVIAQLAAQEKLDRQVVDDLGIP